MSSVNFTDWIDARLEALRSGGGWRELQTAPRSGGRFLIDGAESLNFSSNDYLNLSVELSRPSASVIEAAVLQYGTASVSSRLVTGSLPPLEQLETRLSRFFGFESALLFGAGYLANSGVIPTLVGRGDAVVADRLVHASLIDGCLLSRAEFVRFKHNCLESLEQCLVELTSAATRPARLLVVTESLFSMDGDYAPLTEIAELCNRYQAMLLVDEAHALGVCGPGGRGRVAELGLTSKVAAVSATLSKAFAAYGGIILSDRRLRDLMINEARSQIFNTAIPPLVAVIANLALEQIEANPSWDQELLAFSATARRNLYSLCSELGLNQPSEVSSSQIIPIIIGANDQAISVSAALKKRGIIARAIRPPTVPPGTARLRLSLTRAHTGADIDRLLVSLKEALNEVRG